MKKTLLLTAALGTMLLYTGCDSVDKAEAHMEKIEAKLESIEKQLAKEQSTEVKKGVPCDNTFALQSLKNLMDKHSDGEYEIDLNNIVVWDYNPVGRYNCRAKVKKISDKNPLGKKIDSYMSSLLYGLSDGGWVHYHTYITTADENNFYVGLKMLKEE